MKMWESLDLHSLPPELQHISRNGLFPYSLWSVIKILTWYYQTHFFSKSAALHLLLPLPELFQEGKTEDSFHTHLCILCSKMKLIIPVF